jgi:hypothetical protein
MVIQVSILNEVRLGIVALVHIDVPHAVEGFVKLAQVSRSHLHGAMAFNFAWFEPVPIRASSPLRSGCYI